MESKRVIGNRKVAKNRDKKAWREAILKGRRDGKKNPSKLKRERIKAGIPMTVMAELCKLSLTTYCAIERGYRSVRPSRAAEIAWVFRSEVNVFFNQKKNKKGTHIFFAKK